MLKLELNERTEAFRRNLQEWLSANPPPQVTRDSSLEAFIEAGRLWQQQLASGRWVGVHWPSAFGGRSLSLVEEAVVQEELTRIGAPQLLGLFGLTMVGPVLIQYGTDAQKERFLANILSAREIWCQGFSEPQAGSDLAALRTKAIRVEDPHRGPGFLLSGAKVWTSFAHIADWCFVLCRSLPESTKYEGFSYLLVDMTSQGVSFRPLRQISGESEFNEVHFDEVFVPAEHLLGQEGDGWKIAISTLMYERVVLTFARQLQSEVLLRKLLTDRSRGYTTREKASLVKEAVEFCAVRALAYDHLLDYSSGKAPGPEGSLDKLHWTDSYQSLSKLALELRETEGALQEDENPDGLRYLYSRGRSIAAGTSEIQRNIIAERLLDSPRLKYKE